MEIWAIIVSIFGGINVIITALSLLYAGGKKPFIKAKSHKEEHKDLKKCEGFMKIELSINETEAEIEALRKYYNDIITDYNKIVKSFPSNIVSLVCKFKNKNYFDGKELNKNKNEVKL